MNTSTAIRPLRAFSTEVARIEELGPHFRRITFASRELRGMGADADGHTLDLRIKVIVPPQGEP